MRRPSAGRADGLISLTPNNCASSPAQERLSGVRFRRTHAQRTCARAAEFKAAVERTPAARQATLERTVSARLLNSFGLISQGGAAYGNQSDPIWNQGAAREPRVSGVRQPAGRLPPRPSRARSTIM